MRVNTPLSNNSKKGFGDVLQMHSIHRNLLQFSSVLIFCLFVGLVLLSMPVHAASLESAVTATSPHDGAQYVSVDSPITVTFDRNITLSTDTTKITLVNSTTNSNVVIQPVTVSGKTLTITPKQNLDFGSTYVLNIAQDGVTDTANGNATFLTQTNKLSFSTDSCTFTELMINNTPKIVDWLNIQGYTPRNIKLFAPTRYINGVDVLHKNNTTVTSNANEGVSESVSNFDIITDSRIQRVTITINALHLGTPNCFRQAGLPVYLQLVLQTFLPLLNLLSRLILTQAQRYQLTHIQNSLPRARSRLWNLNKPIITLHLAEVIHYMI